MSERSITMPADSTQKETDRKRRSKNDDNKSRRDRSSSRKVRRRSRSVKVNGSDEEDRSEHDSDLDLDKEFKPISGYVDNREEMVEHMFRSISKRKLRAMLPEILRPSSNEELKKLCVQQLLVMSKKRIIRILEGVEIDAISSSEESDIIAECNAKEIPVDVNAGDNFNKGHIPSASYVNQEGMVDGKSGREGGHERTESLSSCSSCSCSDEENYGQQEQRTSQNMLNKNLRKSLLRGNMEEGEVFDSEEESGRIQTDNLTKTRHSGDDRNLYNKELVHTAAKTSDVEKNQTTCQTSQSKPPDDNDDIKEKVCVKNKELSEQLFPNADVSIAVNCTEVDARKTEVGLNETENGVTGACSDVTSVEGMPLASESKVQQTQLEILELEMRARAIKAMLMKLEQVAPPTSENFPIQESGGNVSSFAIQQARQSIDECNAPTARNLPKVLPNALPSKEQAALSTSSCSTKTNTMLPFQAKQPVIIPLVAEECSSQSQPIPNKISPRQSLISLQHTVKTQKQGNTIETNVFNSTASYDRNKRINQQTTKPTNAIQSFNKTGNIVSLEKIIRQQELLAAKIKEARRLANAKVAVTKGREQQRLASTSDGLLNREQKMKALINSKGYGENFTKTVSNQSQVSSSEIHSSDSNRVRIKKSNFSHIGISTNKSEKTDSPDEFTLSSASDEDTAKKGMTTETKSSIIRLSHNSETVRQKRLQRLQSRNLQQKPPQQHKIRPLKSRGAINLRKPKPSFQFKQIVNVARGRIFASRTEHAFFPKRGSYGVRKYSQTYFRRYL